jgi:hypothetical protein
MFFGPEHGKFVCYRPKLCRLCMEYVKRVNSESSPSLFFDLQLQEHIFFMYRGSMLKSLFIAIFGLFLRNYWRFSR